MPLLRVVLECGQQDVEALSRLLEQFEAHSISSEALSDEALFGGVGEDPRYWTRTAVTALFDDSIDLDILLACARNRINDEHLNCSRVEAVKDENWLTAHQDDGGIMVFGDRLCVKPGWAESDKEWPVTLLLDPGLAFGTGRHETTALCLEWLSMQQLNGQGVIDYGCGSGILGIAAALLGADPVYAFDIDPQALLATAQNAEKNCVSERVSVCQSASAIPTADILMANILLNPLVGLAPGFAGLLRTNGQLVLSGILSTQVDDCLAAFAPWFTMAEPSFNEEWAMLEGRRYSNETLES